MANRTTSAAAVALPPSAESVHPSIRMPAVDRHRQLLKAAIASFSRNGFGGTKTKDIAAAAGVSEAILFRHFASKEDLYHAILDTKEEGGDVERRLSDLRALAAKRDDAGVIRYVVELRITSAREDPAFFRLLLFAFLEGNPLGDLFHQRFGFPTGDFLRQYVQLRQKERAFRPCDPGAAAMFIFGAPTFYAMGRYLFENKSCKGPDEAVVNELTALILGGLLNSSSGTISSRAGIAKPLGKRTKSASPRAKVTIKKRKN